MKKILCICFSTTLQRTVNFSTLKINEVNRSLDYSYYASGKAINTARVLTQLQQGSAICICPTGEKNEQTFLDLASRDNLEIRNITIPGFIRECWTLLDKENQTTTEIIVSEPTPLTVENSQIIRNAEIKLLKLITQAFTEVEGVILSGSRPTIWSEDLYSTIAGMAQDNQKIFLADYIGSDLQKTLQTAVPQIIKINEEEFCKTFNISEDFNNTNNLNSSEVLKSAIIEKSKEFKNIIIVTRGAKSTFAAQNGKFYECPTQKVDITNTTACGDSFNAGFLYEFLNSNDIEKSLTKGTWCATKNAQLEAPGAIM